MRCKQKILALLLAVALLLAMSSTALAADNVCKIGDTEYPSLAKAVEAVPADDHYPAEGYDRRWGNSAFWEKYHL